MLNFMFFLYFILSYCNFAVAVELHHVVINPLSMNVDFVPRNTKVGEDETHKITLQKWISVSDHAVLGLSREGAVFGVVSLDKINEETGQKVRKNYAYLLSGSRVIEEIFLDDNDTFWAVDRSGQILVFDRLQWSKTPLIQTIRFISGGLMDDISIFGILFLTTKWMFFTPWDLDVIPTSIIAGMGATGFGISQFLRGAITYERINRMTDAFVTTRFTIPLGAQIKERFAEFVEGIRLNKTQLQNREIFDRTCELELLPLPVDHSQWKP